MKSFHENLLEAVMRRVKSSEQLDQWLCGESMVVFELSGLRGVYCGNSMLRLDGGGIVNLDPTKITGASFKLIIRSEDAELAFREIEGKVVDLTNQITALSGELQKSGEELDDALGRESEFNDKLDALQAEMKETLETVVTDQTEQPFDMKEEPAETEGFSDETKDKAGIE
jgi:hypothetical protein